MKALNTFSALFSFDNFLNFWYDNTFVFVWHLLSNYKLSSLKLKIFISQLTGKLCNLFLFSIIFNIQCIYRKIRYDEKFWKVFVFWVNRQDLHRTVLQRHTSKAPSADNQTQTMKQTTFSTKLTNQVRSRVFHQLIEVVCDSFRTNKVWDSFSIWNDYSDLKDNFQMTTAY